MDRLIERRRREKKRSERGRQDRLKGEREMIDCIPDLETEGREQGIWIDR